MATFIVRNDRFFVQYVRESYRYFFHTPETKVKITIRKNSVFIHISSYYCVICNDLKYLQRNGRLEADKKSLEWLSKYDL